MIRPEDCSFVSGHLMNDGAGRNGWGVAAFLTTRDGQATPVGYELGFQSSTPTNYSRTNAGALERVGDTVWHFGNAMGVSAGIALAALDVSDPTDMRVIWDRVLRTWPVHLDASQRWMPVYLRAEGDRLYVWKNFDATSSWHCRVWDISQPMNPIPGTLLSWAIPAVWDHRGRDHHAVSRGALYVLNPATWQVHIYNCQEPSEIVLAGNLPMPAQMHAAARIAA
ncbi:MAG TPA: hypothetical protein VM283_02950, partial [Armatimonadota bacterium]|nr:hypothetical protein [Armatimonadota bacterium]